MTQVHEAVTAWLGGLQCGPARLRVVRSRYATSAALFNVHVDLPGGERRRAVYKRPARGLRPAFLYDPGREAWMYASVLPEAPMVDAPSLLAHGPGWLLLEWAGMVDLSQVGDRGVWREAARRLGRFHAWGEAQLERMAGGVPTPWGDPAFQLRWAHRAQRFNPGLQPLWRDYPVAVRRLAELPPTVVHGDFNAANILVERRGGAARIRVVDWETAGIGPGLLDLASLISGGWSEPERDALVAAYREGLGACALAALPLADFESALLLCRLVLAVRWLGWAPAWLPPARQARDWRTEALSLAQRAGLVDRVA